jgi:RHS repeat-associated protein
MAGDRIHTSVQYYYPTLGAQPEGNGLNSLLGVLASVISNSAGAGILKTASGTLAEGVGLDPAVVSFFNNQNNTPVAEKPRAYLNILFFDEQFKMDAGASMFRQVGTGTMNPDTVGQIGFMAGSAALAKKSGYCYIYISNETDDLVYFDNFTLAHERSSLMEETHYYPFGLIMAGISSKAAGTIQNKEKTFQGQRFDDDLGLNWVQFKWRNHDPQIGRFIEIDPLAEEYEYNSTYAFSENKVTNHIELEGLEAIPVSRDLWQQAQTLPPQAKVVAGIGIGLFALAEFIFNNPEALSGGGRSQSYPATFDLYIKSGETKATVVQTEPIQQQQAKQRSASDQKLIDEAKQQKAKEGASKTRNQQRQQQTTDGKAKEGKSNQGTKGSHDSGSQSSADKQKHDKAEARRAREQAAADKKKEEAKKN